MKAFLKKIAQKYGYDILHLPTDPLVRLRLDLLKQYDINLIFDIGANVGQYAQKMREIGYQGEIVSFEPLPREFEQLKKKAEGDFRWKVAEFALGNFNGTAEINLAQNSYSSSILDILPVHVESAPDSIYVGTQTVKVRRLDDVLEQYYLPGQNILVKIDTQGFERQVFEGCIASLSKIKGFQMELSIVPLYEGETLMQEMVDLLRSHGFKLKLIEGGHRNYETGELLQVEGYFYR